MNIWDNIAKKKTISSKLAAHYQHNIEHLLNNELDFQGKKILDAGCGTGRFSFYFQRQGAHVTGIDSSRTSIQLAQKELNKKKITNITFKTGNITNLPYENNTFDITFTCLVLQHILDSKLFKKAITELIRVTKPGGYICILEIVSGIEKKRTRYIALRPAKTYIHSFRPHEFISHKGVRFPYFNHAIILASKKIFLRQHAGDVTDTYALYEKIEKSRYQALFSAAMLAAYYCSIPFTLASRKLRFLSPERLIIFKKK